MCDSVGLHFFFFFFPPGRQVSNYYYLPGRQAAASCYGLPHTGDTRAHTTETELSAIPRYRSTYLCAGIVAEPPLLGPILEIHLRIRQYLSK